MPAKVILKEGKSKPIRRGHPWIFSGAVASVQDYQHPGQFCDIFAHDRTLLARGYINRNSQITCRILVHGQRPIDADLLRERIQAAHRYRRRTLPAETDAYRLINAEGDFLPGLMVDAYADGLVCQFSTAGMDRLREQIIPILDDLLAPAFIYERSDVSARAEEGLSPRTGILTGRMDAPVEIREHGVRFQVDPGGGQKTGFYLDQRDSRRLFGSLARDRKVCDCFCYTAGFSAHALTGGAKSLVAVDSSREALDLGRQNLALNPPNEFPAELVCQDVFEYLRQSTGPFDLMVVDPPPFARRRADLTGAARGYKDVNLWALKNLDRGGILLTFSCSRAVDRKLFQQIIFAAAVDARREVRIIARLGLPGDHPVSVFHPQGEYLKGLALHVT
jgi:23S rRNA (cytosine1962-C5)-methyltransferase